MKNWIIAGLLLALGYTCIQLAKERLKPQLEAIAVLEAAK